MTRKICVDWGAEVKHLSQQCTESCTTVVFTWSYFLSLRSLRVSLYRDRTVACPQSPRIRQVCHKTGICRRRHGQDSEWASALCGSTPAKSQQASHA